MTVVHTMSDAGAACEFAATEIAAEIARAREARGVVHFALSGGRTPGRVYELLAELIEDWSGVELWYGDERCVRPEDPESTHRLVVETLLEAIERRGVPAPLEHRVRGEYGPEAAAREYEALMRERVPAGAEGLPALDVSLLGLGEDGHTASLFPGHREVEAVNGVCLPVRESPKPPPERVTLTMPALRAARRTLLLVTGAAKAQALAAVLAGPDPAVPASLLGGERLHVVTDRAAHPGG